MACRSSCCTPTSRRGARSPGCSSRCSVSPGSTSSSSSPSATPSTATSCSTTSSPSRAAGTSPPCRGSPTSSPDGRTSRSSSTAAATPPARRTTAATTTTSSTRLIDQALAAPTPEEAEALWAQADRGRDRGRRLGADRLRQDADAAQRPRRRVRVPPRASQRRLHQRLARAVAQHDVCVRRRQDCRPISTLYRNRSGSREGPVDDPSQVVHRQFGVVDAQEQRRARGGRRHARPAHPTP